MVSAASAGVPALTARTMFAGVTPRHVAALWGSYSTGTVPRVDRLDYWRDLLDSVVIRGSIRALVDSTFRGSIYTRRSPGGLLFTEIVSTPQEIVHDRQHVARLEEDMILLVFQIRGRSTICQEGREVILEPGDFAFREGRMPSQVRFDSAFRELVIKIPRAQFVSRLLIQDKLCAVKVSGKSGVGAVVSSFLHGFVDQIKTLQNDVLGSLENNVVDLLSAALGPAIDRQPSSAAQRAAHLVRLKASINRHLADPDLCPRLVADENGISTRYLHKLFESANTSFGTYVRERRLQRCYQDLASVSLSHLSITEIFLGWGFNDPSHFSRVFRARYRVSPRAHRAQSRHKPVVP